MTDHLEDWFIDEVGLAEGISMRYLRNAWRDAGCLPTRSTQVVHARYVGKPRMVGLSLAAGF